MEKNSKIQNHDNSTNIAHKPVANKAEYQPSFQMIQSRGVIIFHNYKFEERAPSACQVNLLSSRLIVQIRLQHYQLESSISIFASTLSLASKFSHHLPHFLTNAKTISWYKARSPYICSFFPNSTNPWYHFRFHEFDHEIVQCKDLFLNFLTDSYYPQPQDFTILH